MILLIDNYDSFTYNLVRYFREIGEQVIVKRNDAITLQQIEQLKPQHLVISPGPATPNDAGISLAVIEHFKDKLPILGVCLGHQCIGQSFGANIIIANNIMHGKTSLIHHNNHPLWQDIPGAFVATRYHSLILDPHNLPDCLEVIAWHDKDNSEIMAIAHRQLPLYGVQFHPESILTKVGHKILQNFIRLGSSI